MTVTWGIALVVLVLSHVGMFALGVAGSLFLRWMNFRPLAGKPQMSDQKLMQMADRMARQQVNAERYAYFQRNQEVNRGPIEEERVEEAFAPKPK